MNAKDIGYVVKVFPRLSETFILNEILELERQGLRLHIFSLKQPADKVYHAQAHTVKSPVIYLPERLYRSPWRVMRGLHHGWSKYRKAWRHTLGNVLRRLREEGNTRGLRAFCQACCLIREMPGVGHLHAHFANAPARIAMLVHRLTGASFSITTHAKDIFYNNPFASTRLRERMSQARFVVANSRFSTRYIRSHVDGEAEIHTVYNGLDLVSFPARATTPTDPLILSVGRLVEKKGFGDLIKACALLKNRGIKFTCELVGTGQLSGAIKQQIRELRVGDQIRMVGPLPQEILREHYERATVFVLPCVQAADGDRDILPNVIKEAMAIGVPVVTTRLDGIEELVEDETSGLLVPPGDPESLAAKIERLLDDAGLQGRLAAQGRKVIEDNFDCRANVAGLKSLLVAAAGRGRNAADKDAPINLNSCHANRLHHC